MKRSLLPLLLAAITAFAAGPKPASFTVKGDQFQLDGKPFVIRAGEMHYPRVPRAYWRDRMRKMRAMGLNALNTYVFWNLHEPKEGHFDFEGQLDLAAYLRTAQEEGLRVILRPGPYICTEWDLGGLPAWLLAKPGMELRSTHPAFLAASARYLKRVGQEVAGLQAPAGGPILLVQVENEYGSFGHDKAYLGAIRQQVLDAGFTRVPLFTSDGPDAENLAAGTLPEVLSVINFGATADPSKPFEALARFRPGAPRMVGEWWAGWFDHWGRPHHRVSDTEGARGLDWLLQRGISFSLYMVHGGTSFGFMAGANWDGDRYWPDTTSYDYDVMLDEAGRPTAKFHATRAVLARHLPKGEKLPELPHPLPAITIPPFICQESAPLGQLLTQPTRSDQARSMETFGQSHGLILYRAQVAKPVREVLELPEVRDFAVVMQGERVFGTLDRRLKQTCLDVDLKPGSLDILVEAMGRINFDREMLHDVKGLDGPVRLGGRELRGFEVFSLPLDDLRALRFQPGPVTGPAFHRATFELGNVGDTFLDLRGWGKGYVFVNGHNLGRFWSLGPTGTLFCPAPWLRPGTNEVLVLDLSPTGHRGLQGLKDPVLDLRD